jgi:hypothetical protein
MKEWRAMKTVWFVSIAHGWLAMQSLSSWSAKPSAPESEPNLGWPGISLVFWFSCQVCQEPKQES